jgi:hypothetical protein
MTKPQTGEIWQHYKTKGEYEIIGTGQMQVKIEELDMQECVIYKAFSDKKLWVRPLSDFVENVVTEDGEEIPRFIKIK